MKENIRKISAIIYAILICLFGILHITWVFGGSLFLSEQRGGPWKNSLGGYLALITWSGISLFFFASLLVLGRVNLIWKKIPQWFYAVSCWIITVCMFLGATVNFLGHSTRARLGWGPFWLILFFLILIVALPKKKDA